MAAIPNFFQSEMHSLQYLAAMRVTISVCESNEIQKMIGEFREKMGNTADIGFMPRKWKKLHNKVIRELAKMKFPKPLMDMVLENLWPIAFEVFQWIVYHNEDTGIEYSSRFCWNSRFKIHYTKTAKILVKNEALNIEMRFKLACLYCLESEVRSLWEQMSLSERTSFLNRRNLWESIQNPIVIYWTYYIQDYWRSERLDHTPLYNFAVENGYIYPTRFFLEKLEINTRNETILSSVNIHLLPLIRTHRILRDHLDIVCLLVGLVSHFQRIDYDSVLMSIFLFCLKWPMQKHFLTIVNLLQHSFTRNLYIYILERIFQKIMGNFKDYDYKQLFMEVWHRGSELNKTFIRMVPEFGYQLFMKFVKKHFRFIFKERYFALKAKFRDTIIQPEMSGTETYFEKENVIFLKFLVQERVTTKRYILTLTNRPFWNTSIRAYDNQFCHLPVEEITHLIDGILEIV